MSSNSPILATTTYRDRVPMVFRVEGGLHMIRGNRKPFFSLTYTAHRKGFPNQCYSGGAGHDEILKRFPQFADLAALHLSDINGSPLYAVENGWFLIQKGNKDAVMRHFRVSSESALRIMSFCDSKERAAATVSGMRARWKAEAGACIAKHGLVIFGDEYKPEA